VAWTDAELVRRTRAGDREAFGVLVERHRRTIYVLALRKGLQAAEAEDAAQEVFLKAYRNLGSLADPQAFARWLYGITAHVVADAGRARARRHEEGSLERAPEPLAPVDSRADLLFGEERRLVFRALEEMAEEQRLVILLRYVEGLTPKQIAERLGEPRGTIRSRLHHALAFLQTALAGSSGTDKMSCLSPDSQTGGNP
jgi:RNA polymerase sigma-70 factor (ECF subfamily)